MRLLFRRTGDFLDLMRRDVRGEEKIRDILDGPQETTQTGHQETSRTTWGLDEPLRDQTDHQGTRRTTKPPRRITRPPRLTTREPRRTTRHPDGPPRGTRCSRQCRRRRSARRAVTPVASTGPAVINRRRAALHASGRANAASQLGRVPLSPPPAAAAWWGSRSHSSGHGVGRRLATGLL